jgi:N6-adenosine-specific RNA methylase IME4
MGEYRTIVADPPWPYSPQRTNLTAKSQRGLKIADHYESMTIADLCTLKPPAADNAHLYLWTTNAFMVEAHEVACAWGFEPKTICTYVKVCKDDPTRVSRKSGYWFRGATEHFLFCVRGSLKLQTTEALPTAFLWPRLPHSVKPDAFYDLVEKASPEPYLELFARRERLGWDTWGDQSANSSGLDLVVAA